MKKIVLLATLGIIMVFLAGCVGEDKGTPTPVPTGVPTETIPVPTGTEIPIQDLNETEQKLVNLAKEDLADRLQISINDIKLTKIEAITWPDSSLGVSEPDKVYMPVETPGYIIELYYNNTVYEYHSNYEIVVFAPKAEK